MFPCNVGLRKGFVTVPLPHALLNVLRCKAERKGVYQQAVQRTDGRSVKHGGGEDSFDSGGFWVPPWGHVVGLPCVAEATEDTISANGQMTFRSVTGFQPEHH